MTAIELKPTSQGIEIVLKTTDSKRLQTFTSSFGKTLVANVINTQLQLPDGNAFRQSNPIQGIAYVSVTSPNANSIRTVVTGKTELPKAIVTQSDRTCPDYSPKAYCNASNTRFFRASPTSFPRYPIN